MNEKEGPRLGRGLNDMLGEASLIRAGTGSRPSGGGYILAPVEALEPAPWMEKAGPDLSRVERLAESVRSHGVLEPVLIRKSGDDRYVLLHGHTRFTAACRAGFTAVPARVVELDDKDAILLYAEERLSQGADEDVRNAIRSYMTENQLWPADEVERLVPPLPTPEPVPATAAEAETADHAARDHHAVLVFALLALFFLITTVLLFFRTPEPFAGEAAAVADIGEAAEGIDGQWAWMRSFGLPGASAEAGPGVLTLVCGKSLFEDQALSPEGRAFAGILAERMADRPEPLAATLTGEGPEGIARAASLLSVVHAVRPELRSRLSMQAGDDSRHNGSVTVMLAREER